MIPKRLVTRCFYQEVGWRKNDGLIFGHVEFEIQSSNQASLFHGTCFGSASTPHIVLAVLYLLSGLMILRTLYDGEYYMHPKLRSWKLREM